jgi:hypothetical protein
MWGDAFGSPPRFRPASRKPAFLTQFRREARAGPLRIAHGDQAERRGLIRRTLRQRVNEAPIRRANLHPQARFRYRINND